ncbi:MAG: SUMF1/EgtB/PvdO family nonheme iron enzyme [Ignavibacteriales bacterium]|nr:SUMF1/EgtB/PvdO family nonheme iron enzyme [Ignavibacteriales bacterium]
MKINSNMKDLIVEIDGEVTDQQAQYELVSGNHSIRVTAANCSEYTTQVTITRGKTTSIKANLEKLTGEVILNVVPADALVMIGVANYENARKLELEPGTYKMHLSSDLYDSKTIDLVVVKGKTQRMNVQLVKNAGTLSLTRKPETAKIRVDGKDYGASDKIELRPGQYLLQADVDSSYQQFMENIVITKNKTTKLKVDVKRRKGIFLFNSIPHNTRVRLLQKGETKFEFKGTGIIEELPVGEYNLIVQSPGHKSIREAIIILEGKNYSLDLKLEQGVEENLKTETTVSPTYLKKIDGGYFSMGATLEQGSGTRMELPVRTVAVNMFYIGTTEVTQGLWNEVMGENPSHFKTAQAGNSLPVENISWLEAVKFCNKLSEKEGLTPAYKIENDSASCDFEANGFRLPTEAEWEYAARGDDSTAQFKFSGSRKVDEVAWIKSNSDKRTQPVAQKSPNKNGLYDMTGNVAELCNDFYDKYNPADLLNPKGPQTGKKIAIRGGSWNSTDGKARISARESNGTGARKSTTGLRLVRSSQ